MACTRWLRGLVLPTAALLAATPHPGSAQGFEFWKRYQDGVQAFERRDWATAERKLTEALDLEPAQSRQKKVVESRKLYIPDYYLGRVFQETGRHREALVRFARLRDQGLITPRDGEYTQLTALVRRSEQELLRAEAASPVPSPESSPRVAVASPVPEPTRAAPPSPTPTAAPPVDPEAGRRVLLARLTDDVEKLLRAGRYGEARSAIQAGLARGLDTSGLSRRVDDLERRELVGQLRRAIAGGRPETLQDLIDRAEQLGGLVGGDAALVNQARARLSAISPGSLERAALSDYYRGDYAEAQSKLSKLLNPGPFSDRAYLYLACSEAALSILRPSEGTDLLARARANFERARRGSTRFDVDRKYIAPRILEILEGAATTRAAGS